MTPATPTTFPSDWTTSSDGSVVTAPDGNTAQGNVLTLFHATFAQVDTLTAKLAALTPPPADDDTGPTQAAFDSLSAEVDSLKTEVDTITKTLDTFAAAITATEPAPATA